MLNFPARNPECSLKRKKNPSAEVCEANLQRIVRDGKHYGAERPGSRKRLRLLSTVLVFLLFFFFQRNLAIAGVASEV